MHIAFDGGCFQQGILGGIYQVACGFLNAAKKQRPDLQVTLVCDPRQGLVRDEALAGLSFKPDTVYAPVAASYDPLAHKATMLDPEVRFYVDGQIISAVAAEGIVRYSGPAPTEAFAIVSRAAVSSDAQDTGNPTRRGICIEQISISGNGSRIEIDGSDRRLVAGFHADHTANREGRWTDGAGFVPLVFFTDAGPSVSVAVRFHAQDEYSMTPGLGADLVRRTRLMMAEIERDRLLADLGKDLRKRGCSVYFANHFTPIAVPGMINVAWAYDLIPVLLPQYFHPDARRNFDENLRIFEAADRVYTISNTTRNDLIANTPVTTTQAIAAGIACSGDYARRPQSAVQQVLHPIGLAENGYILAVATIEPRKNHLRMLMAYMSLRERMPDCPKLLLVGTLGWDYLPLLHLRADHGLEHVVYILSDVTEDELACFYSGALFSAYLSVYEGFGLPIVEAMTAGCPVLTSDRSSMAEVAGDAAMLVNPYDIDAISAAMERMVTDGRLREKLVQRGSVRARDYSWDISSATILQDLAALTGDD